MLHEYFAPTVPKSFGNNERVDREENDDRNASVALGPSFPVGSVKIGSTKAALKGGESSIQFQWFTIAKTEL